MIKITPREVQKLPYYSAERKKLSKQILQLEKKRDNLDAKIESLEKITEFFGGCPLCIHHDYLNVWALTVSSPGSLRHAHVYHNAREPKTVDMWGIRVEADPIVTFGGKFLGANFTKDEALLIAKKWVALGVLAEGYDVA